MWEENSSGSDIVARLSRVVDVSVASRVIFTTRDSRMALRSDELSVIWLAKGDWEKKVPGHGKSIGNNWLSQRAETGNL